MSTTVSKPSGPSSPELQACILDFLVGLRVPYFHEHSVKCAPVRWQSERALFGVPGSALGTPDTFESLARLLYRLDMPATDLQTFMADYDPERVQYLHLGLEGQRCKVYWEFPMPERLDGSASHHVQYRAWKWHAGEPAAACSDYVILPSAGAARAAIRQTTQAMPALVGELIEQLEISAALKHYPWPPMTVAIDEWLARQSTPRKSLNVHLHEADLPLGTIAGLMMALAREWQAAPQQTLVDWVARHGAERLSNVSLGLGHDSQPFFTCYYGGRVLSPDSKADESGQAQQA